MRSASEPHFKSNTMEQQVGVVTSRQRRVSGRRKIVVVSGSVEDALVVGVVALIDRRVLALAHERVPGRLVLMIGRILHISNTVINAVGMLYSNNNVPEIDIVVPWLA